MATTKADLSGLGKAPKDEVPTFLDDPGSGLSEAQAAQRLAEDGPNALPGGQRCSMLSIAAETVREPMFLLLLARTPNRTLWWVVGLAWVLLLTAH